MATKIKSPAFFNLHTFVGGLVLSVRLCHALLQLLLGMVDVRP